LAAAGCYMVPESFEDYEAAFPTGATNRDYIKAFWCRSCQGEVKPPKAELLSCSLANLYIGGGPRCKCAMSLMERCAEDILKNDPEFTDVLDQTLITTKSPGLQRVDHNCTYEGHRVVFEWDGKQHFQDKDDDLFDYDVGHENDIYKVEAIHAGELVNKCKVKFLVRMSQPRSNVWDKIQLVLDHFKSEVKKLTSEKLNDNKVILICLPEDKKKYTPLGLPKKKDTW
ncbi:hypothetical protein TrRE_jg11951, partial [Triparma retinervis]